MNDLEELARKEFKSVSHKSGFVLDETTHEINEQLQKK